MSRITTACRVRPCLGDEDPAAATVRVVKGAPSVAVGKRVFDFDVVFGHDSTDDAVFASSVAPLLQRALVDRTNASIVLYGQTGSGKTHSAAGIAPLVLRTVCQHLTPARISLGAIDVYSDTLRDLLNVGSDGACTPVTMFDGDGGTRLVGATVATVESLDDAMWLFNFAAAHRATASTRMNSASSRSHAVYTIYCNAGDAAFKISIIDLAGSERNKKTQNVGQRFQESIGINSELLALGNVIRAAAVNASHVPYRACKLTRLLQDAIGGNSHTLFLACVSPTQYNEDESVRTLQYAATAIKIVNAPVATLPAAPPRPEEPEAARHALDDAMQQVRQLAAANSKLAAENKRLQADAAAARLQASRLADELETARGDLRKDEKIFAEKLRAVKRLTAENDALKDKVASLEHFTADWMARHANDAFPKSGASTPPERVMRRHGNTSAPAYRDPTPSTGYVAQDQPSPSPGTKLHEQCNGIAAGFETSDAVLAAEQDAKEIAMLRDLLRAARSDNDELRSAKRALEGQLQSLDLQLS